MSDIAHHFYWFKNLKQVGCLNNNKRAPVTFHIILIYVGFRQCLFAKSKKKSQINNNPITCNRLIILGQHQP